MPARWKIFIVANYLFVLFFGFALFKLIELLIKFPPGDDVPFIAIFLLFSSVSVIMINAAYNIIIFHLHFPRKPLGRTRLVFYKCAAVLGCVATAGFLFFAGLVWKEEMKHAPQSSWLRFIQGVFLSTFVIGLYIQINQFFAQTYLSMQYKRSLDKLIDDIGKIED